MRTFVFFFLPSLPLSEEYLIQQRVAEMSKVDNRLETIDNRVQELAQSLHSVVLGMHMITAVKSQIQELGDRLDNARSPRASTDDPDFTCTTHGSRVTLFYSSSYPYWEKAKWMKIQNMQSVGDIYRMLSENQVETPYGAVYAPSDFSWACYEKEFQSLNSRPLWKFSLAYFPDGKV